MGAGKSFAALLAAQNIPAPLLVVAPKHLLGVWRGEIAAVAYDGEQILSSYEDILEHPELLARMPQCTVVLDECHHVFRYSAANAETLFQAVQRAKVRLLLSGTPINEMRQLTALVNVCAGRDFLPVTPDAFNDRYVQQNGRRYVQLRMLRGTLLLSSQLLWNIVTSTLMFKTLLAKARTKATAEGTEARAAATEKAADLSAKSAYVQLAMVFLAVVASLMTADVLANATGHVRVGLLAHDIRHWVSFQSDRSLYKLRERTEKVVLSREQVGLLTRYAGDALRDDDIRQLGLATEATLKYAPMSRIADPDKLSRQMLRLGFWTSEVSSRHLVRVAGTHRRYRFNVPLTTLPSKALVILDFIKRHPRLIIYSYLAADYGSRFISAVLTQAQVSHAVAEADVLDAVVADFNARRVDKLIVDPELTEGWSAKMCRVALLTDPMPLSAQAQITARCRRLGSLDGLRAGKKRVVTATTLVVSLTDSPDDPRVVKGLAQLDDLAEFTKQEALGWLGFAIKGYFTGGTFLRQKVRIAIESVANISRSVQRQLYNHRFRHTSFLAAASVDGSASATPDSALILARNLQKLMLDRLERKVARFNVQRAKTVRTTPGCPAKCDLLLGGAATGARDCRAAAPP